MFTIIKKESIPSTNSCALELVSQGVISSPAVVFADAQTKGRGQAQNKWFSEKGKSLTFSVVVFPEKIKAERQFVLSQIVCLAMYDTLTQYTEGVQIKWPNDIYIHGKKTCGILIENSIMGQHLGYSICGVGLNVNNTSFSEAYVATSLYLESGKKQPISAVLDKFLKQFSYYYHLAEQGAYAKLNSLYHSYLYCINELVYFADKNGKFCAKVVGIDQYGQLLLEDTEKQLRTYGFKEVIWLS